MKLYPETVVCAAPSLADANLHILLDLSLSDDAGSHDPSRSMASVTHNAGLSVYAAKVPLTMGPAVLGSLPDQPSVAPGWLVGLKTPPVGPVVKGNRGINAQTVDQSQHYPT